MAKVSSFINANTCKYALSLLEDTSFIGSKQAFVPLDPIVKLIATADDLLANGPLYQRLTVRFLYLTISRLDITFTINKLSNACPIHVPLILMSFIIFCST